MQYEISGGNLPYLTLKLERGESVMCEAGSMSWMDRGIVMETKGGGLGKMFGRMMTGESMMLNHYHAQEAGEIALASSFPGQIVAVRVTPDKPIIVQKKGFLASMGNLNMSVFLQKKIASGFFGGEGFLMQKFEGDGIVFVEIDGSAVEFELAPGQQKVIDTGYLVMMDSTCQLTIETVKGVKNIVFGGEGLFNTIVTGPGRIVLQSMPASNLAAMIGSYLPTKG